jgi:8-hydroxy-5-deazaflavin:NADPH oxidoreductase
MLCSRRRTPERPRGGRQAAQGRSGFPKCALGCARKVVKASNTILAQLLPTEAREGRDPVQVFVAGDEDAAKKAVFDLVSKGGFQPVESGPLSNSQYLEPLGEINIHFGFFLGWGTSAAPAWIKAAG